MLTWCGKTLSRAWKEPSCPSAGSNGEPTSLPNAIVALDPTPAALAREGVTVLGVVGESVLHAANRRAAQVTERIFMLRSTRGSVMLLGDNENRQQSWRPSRDSRLATRVYTRPI